MQRLSIRRRLGQHWMYVVAVMVVVVAGFAVYRLQGIFASHDVTSTPSGAVNDIVPFNPKHVVMEVYGPPGTVATVTYLDALSTNGAINIGGSNEDVPNLIKKETDSENTIYFSDIFSFTMTSVQNAHKSREVFIYQLDSEGKPIEKF